MFWVYVFSVGLSFCSFFRCRRFIDLPASVRIAAVVVAKTPSFGGSLTFAVGTATWEGCD